MRLGLDTYSDLRNTAAELKNEVRGVIIDLTAGNRIRARQTNAILKERGWAVLRSREHDDLLDFTDQIAVAVRSQRA